MVGSEFGKKMKKMYSVHYSTRYIIPVIYVSRNAQRRTGAEDFARTKTGGREPGFPLPAYGLRGQAARE